MELQTNAAEAALPHFTAEAALPHFTATNVRSAAEIARAQFVLLHDKQLKVSHG